jgi:hypothetical protein
MRFTVRIPHLDVSSAGLAVAWGLRATEAVQTARTRMTLIERTGPD